MNEFALTIVLTLGAAIVCAAQPVQVTLDGQSGGKTFEGIGGLSAGASSRMLMEYPKAQRDVLLDLLFKPRFGLSLQDLKVEIGGDINSTWGTEPSIARTREEFVNPKPEYFQRGYEWWLMKEAKRRNPNICFGSLQWGAPGWIGNGEFTSQENADFIAAFIKGARDYHGIRIFHQGLWNEKAEGYNIPWIKTLRKTLDKNGLQDTHIQIADGILGDGWKCVDDLFKDEELNRAVYAVGSHYGGAPEAARKLGKPLWSTEDSYGGRSDWDAALHMASRYNKHYILSRITKVIFCCPIAAYYDNLLAPYAGMITANSPWSGNFEIMPTGWTVMHTTQFAEAGWKYLDSSCSMLKVNDNYIGSYVTLKKPDASGDYSLIIETKDMPEAAAKLPLEFKITGGLSTATLHVWRTNKNEMFMRQADITPKDGTFTIEIDPQSLYSLTTTTGQQRPVLRIPPAKPFPFPYHEDFESYAIGKTPRYFADQCGAFEVADRSDGQGKCLRQVVPQEGIEWGVKVQHPWTEIGGVDWSDYEVSVDVLIEKTGSAFLYGRVPKFEWNRYPRTWIRVDQDGNWELTVGKDTRKGKAAFSSKPWHNLKLVFDGSLISAYIDGVQAASLADRELLAHHGQGGSVGAVGSDNVKVVSDGSITSAYIPVGTSSGKNDAVQARGMVGLGSSYDTVEFDNLSVAPIQGAEAAGR